MTCSMKRVEEMLGDEKLLSRQDLGFILTVLRDNSSSDDVCNLLNLFLEKLDAKIKFNIQ